MAQILNIDTGIKEYEINGNGLLRFNPSDPNLYNRFYDMEKTILSISKEFEGKRKEVNTGEEFLRLMEDYDKKSKSELSRTFGEKNDFDKLLGGVNLLATARNGEYIITNVLNALKPIIEEGAKNYAESVKNSAVAAAKARREALHELDTSENS